MTEAPFWQAPGAQYYGDVRFGTGVSLWPNAVLRAEIAHIQVGDYTNLQDMSMVHIGGDATVIGRYCSITHHATVHGAKIGDHCLIGINATIMDGAEIGENSIVAGNSIVREGMVIPPCSVVAGVPARVIAERDNYVANKLNAISYYENAIAYQQGHHRRWSDEDYLADMARLREQLEAER